MTKLIISIAVLTIIAFAQAVAILPLRALETSTVAVPTIAPTISSSDCAKLKGVRSHTTGQCFIHVNQTTTFIQAEIFCENFYNGHLVSLHNAFDNLFVADYAREIFPTIDQYYIGLTSLNGYNNYTWQDGTPVDYTDWYYNSQGTACVSVDMKTALWNKVDCFTKINFVCSL